jgi:hypothetical protein
MTAQKRETGRNYIGLLHEEAEEQRIADISAAAKPRIMDHIIGLMAAMFSRPAERGSYPRPAAALKEGPGTMARSGSRS